MHYIEWLNLPRRDWKWTSRSTVKVEGGAEEGLVAPVDEHVAKLLVPIEMGFFLLLLVSINIEDKDDLMPPLDEVVGIEFPKGGVPPDLMPPTDKEEKDDGDGDADDPPPLFVLVVVETKPWLVDLFCRIAVMIGDGAETVSGDGADCLVSKLTLPLNRVMMIMCNVIIYSGVI